MNILLIEPYYTGSHKAWAKEFQSQSRHTIDILSMKGQFWKWRMHGGGITMANEFLLNNLSPDLILATDMLDLTTFLALTREKTSKIPAVLYFHENQMSYPWSDTDRDVQKNRDKHYGFINIASSLSASHIFFNSNYHKQSFLSGANKLLKHFPDFQEMQSIQIIEEKSSVLPLGIDLVKFDKFKTKSAHPFPLILWNHRWEYDKNPDDFFETLFKLQEKKLKFEIAILGENFEKTPKIFNEAKFRLGEKIIQFGYCPSLTDYAKWLWKADILPVTNFQEFFGVSIMEAVYCDIYPLLPNRLTYPDLFPESLLYNDQKELEDRLEFALKNINYIRDQSFKKYAEKFDWSVMGPVYDSHLEKIISDSKT